MWICWTLSAPFIIKYHKLLLVLFFQVLVRLCLAWHIFTWIQGLSCSCIFLTWVFKENKLVGRLSRNFLVVFCTLRCKRNYQYFQQTFPKRSGGATCSGCPRSFSQRITIQVAQLTVKNITTEGLDVSNTDSCHTIKFNTKTP